MAGAAPAFAKAFTSEKSNQASGSMSVSQPPVTGGVSSWQSNGAKNEEFQQLRCLKQLYDDGILDAKEFAEQKQNIVIFAETLVIFASFPDCDLWPLQYILLHGNQVMHPAVYNV